MAGFKHEFRIKSSDVQIFGPNLNVRMIPEVQFFALRDEGEDVSNFLPQPDGVTEWCDGTYLGVKTLVATADTDIYVVVDDTNLGLVLCHYVYAPDDTTEYRLSPHLGWRKLKLERSKKKMSMGSPSLMDVVRSQQSQRSDLGAGMAGMGAAPTMGAMGGNDGVTGTTDVYRLQREALANSYVTGYIMGAAPAITLALSKKKQKDSAPTFSIIAKESKPSRCLAVLMAIPSRCCKKGGNMATPSEILAGMVDFSTSGNEMLYQTFQVKAAIGYIHAFGDRLAEYAPFVSDTREQWSKEAILSEHPEVSYVRIHATENKGQVGNTQDRFRFSLKTTSPRRSLYTQRNIVCLRALEHMDVKCNTEKAAYELNEAAFGQWRYRKPKTESMNALEKACTSCPDQIWKKTYEIDGQKVNGIGSAFFMAAAEETSENGVAVMRRELQYWPWWQTGALRPDQPSQVRSMVKRVLQAADQKKKERMVTVPILYKEHPDHKAFQPYRAFVDHIISQGYLSMDKLKSMGGRSSKGTRKKQAMTNDQINSLQMYLRNAEVKAEIQAVQESSADREVLAAAGAR